MPPKLFVKRLHDILCDYNRSHGNIYSDAWLSEVDFGGLYYNGTYYLRMNASRELDSYDETEALLGFLFKNFKEEYKLIRAVLIYNYDEHRYPEIDDLIIFEQIDAC